MTMTKIALNTPHDVTHTYTDVFKIRHKNFLYIYGSFLKL